MADNADTGATPGTGATPAQSGSPSAGATPQTPPADPPAKGEEALGEAGQKVLREARAAAKEARDRAAAIQTELDTLKASAQTDGEKAIAKAKREGNAEATNKYQAQLRRSGVKAALAAAGVTAELLDLATKDDVFAELTVSDDGAVEGLDGAITALKKARPSLFNKAGDFGGGNRGTTPETPIDMNTLLRRASGH